MPWKDHLTLAVHIKDHTNVKRLLDEGQSPNRRLNGQTSLLHMAVRENDNRITRTLIEHGADVNALDNSSQTPLFISSDPRIDIEITKILLDAGSNINTKDVLGRTPLHSMSFFLQEEKLQLLLKDTEVDVVNDVDFVGNTALHMCVCDENPNHNYCASTFQYLLKAGADPNIQDSRGRSVLHLGSDLIQPLTDILFAQTLDVNYQSVDKDGDTFLHKLVCNLTLSEVYWFKLFECCAIPTKDWKFLLNSKNLNGQTPFFIYLDLHFYHESVVSKMLELGADANLADDLGVTPLMRACTHSFETTRRLVESGADLNSCNIYEQTALHLAKDNELVSFMVESGADINICDKWNRSPFQQSILSAIQLNTTQDVQRCFLVKGSNINQQDMFGSTALHLAADGNSELITFLLEMGADQHITDANGRVPLDVARRHRNRDAQVELKNGSHSEEKTLTLNHASHEASCENDRLLYVFKDVEQACDELTKDENIETREYHQKVDSAVTELMKSIALKVGEMDSSFEIQVFPSGSSAEGTKADKPDEYDFVFCLPYFSESCEIVEYNSHKSFGLVSLKSKSNPPPKQIAYLFDDHGGLSAYRVRKELESLMQRVIRRRTTWNIDNIKMGGLALSFATDDLVEKPVINFKIAFVDMEYSNLEISIDVALGIQKAGWWPSCINIDSIPLVDDTIKKMGCLVIAQVPGDKSVRDRLLRVVSLGEDGHASDGLPKSVSVEEDDFTVGTEDVRAYYSEFNELIMNTITDEDELQTGSHTIERAPERVADFRISCSLCESHLMRRLPQAMKNGYILAKILKNRICPDIDFEEEANTNIVEQMLFSSAKDYISSYLLKTCLFHIVSSEEEIIYTRDMKTSTDKAKDIAVKLYRFLSDAARRKSLPFHFLPNANLFTYQRVVLEEQDTDDFDDYLDNHTQRIHTYCKAILGCLGCVD